jgi:hypothetical protein
LTSRRRDRKARKGQITGILGGLAQTDNSQQTQAMGSEANLYGQAANTDMQIGGAQHAAQAQQNASIFGGLGSIASLATRYFTGGGYGTGSNGGYGGGNGGGAAPDPYSYYYGGSQSNPVSTTQYAPGSVGP